MNYDYVILFQARSEHSYHQYINNKKMQFNTYNSMASINLLHVSALGHHPQGVAYNKGIQILCFVDRASRYICVIKNNFMHCLSSVYFVNHLYMFRAYLQLIMRRYTIYIYITIGTCCIHTVYLLMMCYKYARNMQRLINEIN